nr:unnamed protein product [Digitaria exilis]
MVFSDGTGSSSQAMRRLQRGAVRFRGQRIPCTGAGRRQPAKYARQIPRTHPLLAREPSIHRYAAPSRKAMPPPSASSWCLEHP